MKRTMLLGLALVMFGESAHANFCARDAVPAATLLVPYAVVDLDANNVPDPNGYTTLMSVINTSSAKQIIHVVVLDALGRHVIEFDEVLSGYDMWTINFRDLLTGSFNLFDTGDLDSKDNGSGPAPNHNPPYPQVGDFWIGGAGPQTPPYGPSSNSYYTTWLPGPDDVDAPSPSTSGCFFPYGPLSQVGAAIVTRLQAAIIGDLPQDGSHCTWSQIWGPPWLATLTPNPVFFSVTVDVVNACSLHFSDEPGYWTDGVPSTNNVLAGNVFYINPWANFSESVPAVAIEADLDWASPTAHAGFYSRYTENFNPPVHDFHEPLPTAFAFQYANSGGVSSYLIVWKNETEFDVAGAGPVSVDACHAYVYYAFDENEDSKARGVCCGSPAESSVIPNQTQKAPLTTADSFYYSEPNVIPFQTQRVPLTVDNWNGLMANNGWMLLIFEPSILGPHTTVGSGSGDVQAWVGVQYYFGTYSTAVEAFTLGNAWCFPSDVLPALNTYQGLKDGVLKR